MEKYKKCAITKMQKEFKKSLDKIKDNYAESPYKCEQVFFMFNFR